MKIEIDYGKLTSPSTGKYAIIGIESLPVCEFNNFADRAACEALKQAGCFGIYKDILKPEIAPDLYWKYPGMTMKPIERVKVERFNPESQFYMGDGAVNSYFQKYGNDSINPFYRLNREALSKYKDDDIITFYPDNNDWEVCFVNKYHNFIRICAYYNIEVSIKVC